MSGRVIFIGMFVGMAIIYIFIYVFITLLLNKKRADGTRPIDDAVNNQTRTDKLSFGEIIVYGCMLVIGILLVYSLVRRGGSGFSHTSRMVIIPVVVSIFNARRRTGHSMMAILGAFLMAIYLMMVYIVIGLPPKAPSIRINQTLITMDKTTAEDLYKDGYEIYVRKPEALYAKYEECLSSGDYKNYGWDRSIMIEKGYQHKEALGGYPDYILVKDGHVIGNIIFYAGEKEDKVLEEASVIGFGMEEGSRTYKEAGIQADFEGIDLMKELNQQELADTFGKHLWLLPRVTKPIDVTSLVYGIQWNAPSDRMFWNNYYSYIRFDEDNFMTSFELYTSPARE